MPPDLFTVRLPETVIAKFKTRIDVLVLVMQLKRLSRACALPKHASELTPNFLDLFKPSASMAAKAEQFGQAVAAEPEVFESHFRDNRRRMIAYAWEIGHIIVGGGDDRVAYEFACACLRANRAVKAQQILKMLSMSENKTSSYVASAKLRVARLAWKAGDYEVALKHLRSLRGRAVRKQYRSWLGLMTIRNGLLLCESGDEGRARSVLMGGLLTSGIGDALAEEITTIYLKATSREPQGAILQTNIAPAVPGHGLTPIILSGFGWSGSGAVTDYLKGHPQVADVFGGREVGLWTGKYGLERIYEHFISVGFNRRLLLEFLARHCFGHMFLADSKGTKSLGGLWSRLDEPKQRTLLQGLAEWLDAVQRWRRNPTDPLLDAFQNLTGWLLSLLVKERAGCVLLSNCVPSDAIVGTRMFKAPVVIVSWRDPCDAYASKKAAFPDASLDFFRWKVQLMARIDNYIHGKERVADNAKLWIDLSFEEFVRNDQLRRHLLTQLGLHEHPINSTFDPTVSAKNIGILRSETGRRQARWDALADAVEKARSKAQKISSKRIISDPGKIPHPAGLSGQV